MLSQLSPQHLAELCKGQWYQDKIPSARFTAAQIDSRLMESNQLFIALRANKQMAIGLLLILTLNSSRRLLLKSRNHKPVPPNSAWLVACVPCRPFRRNRQPHNSH